MKSVQWSNLKSGDVLRYTDNYLDYFSKAYQHTYKNKNLTIGMITIYSDFIGIGFTNHGYVEIELDGTCPFQMIVMFKIIAIGV